MSTKSLLAIVLFCSTAITAESEWTQKRITVTATAYCPCPVCCGTNSDGKTATMRDASLSGVAVDPKTIPLGSRLDIPGYGNWQLADDTGSAIKGNKIDVRFNDHQKAKEWGVKTITIRVWSKK